MQRLGRFTARLRAPLSRTMATTAARAARIPVASRYALGAAAVTVMGASGAAMCLEKKTPSPAKQEKLADQAKALEDWLAKNEVEFDKVLTDGPGADLEFAAGDEIPGLKNYTRKQIEIHNRPEAGCWVIYRNGVFDVTEFVPDHPGGKKILLALGKDVAPFWMIFQQHREARTQRFLETMRIGNLDPADRQPEGAMDENDPYRNDPKGLEEGRHPAMLVHTKAPFTAEPPRELLLESYITPTYLHYIRNHVPVPLVDPKTYRLKVHTPQTVKAGKPLVLTLEDLKTKFPKKKIMNTLQCVGNRVRGAHLQQKAKLMTGTFFDTAMGNSMWAGAMLRDVLMAAGLDEHGSGMKYVQFEALDADESGVPFGGCVTMEKVMDPTGDVLLAYEMNGQHLPRDHGYPVRLIVPGWFGVRNVKWLEKVMVSNEMPDPKLAWYQNDLFVAQEAPVQSLVISPIWDEELDPYDESLFVKGYAWSGGGRRILTVDVSIDDGETWHEARLKQNLEQPKWRSWAWTHWEATIKLPNDLRGTFRVISNASDAAFNQQPSHYRNQWIDLGIVNNQWHRVPVHRPNADE